jgi:hypothetical protein
MERRRLVPARADRISSCGTSPGGSLQVALGGKQVNIKVLSGVGARLAAPPSASDNAWSGPGAVSLLAVFNDRMIGLSSERRSLAGRAFQFVPS